MLSAVHTARADTVATATLSVETSGEGFFDITRDVARFLQRSQARDGAVLVYLPPHWQGIYVAEHRNAPHRREGVLQFVGSCGQH